MEENESKEGVEVTPQQAAQAQDVKDAEMLQGLLSQADGAPSMEAPADPAAEAPVEAAPAGSGEEPEVPAETALESAREELKRNQLHKDVIDALSPEQLLAQAETLRGQRAERDKAFNQQDALMKRLEALEARGAAGSTDTEAGGGDAAQPSDGPAGGPDMSAALQPVDGDLYEGIPEALTATATAMAGYTEERIAAATEPLVDQVKQLTAELVRRELAGEYPQLRDAAAYAKVEKAMLEIQPRVQVEGGSAFDQVYAAMGRASQIELGAADAPTLESPPQSGGLVPPTRQPAPPPSMSADEKSAAWLKAALSTGSATAGNRAAGL